MGVARARAEEEEARPSSVRAPIDQRTNERTAFWPSPDLIVMSSGTKDKRSFRPFRLPIDSGDVLPANKK